MARPWLVSGAISGFVAVAAGAFAAHGLRDVLTVEMRVVFETAVRYQMYHALALLAAGILAGRTPSRTADAAGWFLAVGTLLFSGSLYVLALTGVRAFALITPVGGLALLAGWAALAAAGWRAAGAPR